MEPILTNLLPIYIHALIFLFFFSFNTHTHTLRVPVNKFHNIKNLPLWAMECLNRMPISHTRILRRGCSISLIAGYYASNRSATNFIAETKLGKNVQQATTQNKHQRNGTRSPQEAGANYWSDHTCNVRLLWLAKWHNTCKKMIAPSEAVELCRQKQLTVIFVPHHVIT